MEEYFNDYQEEYDGEMDDRLPPEAKEYYEYKNQIDIMEKEKKFLESTLKEAKESQKSKIPKKDFPFKNNDCTDYKKYEKEILNRMIDEELFGGIGTRKEILGQFVDRVLDRSLYVYKNGHCHTCAKLLNMGKSTQQCPKCHHLLKELDKQKQKRKKY